MNVAQILKPRLLRAGEGACARIYSQSFTNMLENIGQTSSSLCNVAAFVSVSYRGEQRRSEE